MKAKEIGAFEAKTRLSELLKHVRDGQAYVISKRGRPVAELRPVAHPDRRPRFGCDRGRVTIKGNFDEPIPEMKDFTVQRSSGSAYG
jgi:prevent-host-death family protein